MFFSSSIQITYKTLIKNLKLKLKLLKKSFTLLELSLVLSILAILTMATISGFKIIDNSKATAIIQDIQKYREAINNFYNEYEALPGNFDNAQYTFSSETYRSANESTISGLSGDNIFKVQLNGDGLGNVSSKIVSSNGLCKSEAFGVWSQLSAKGYLANRYSNFATTAMSNNRIKCLKVDLNLPKIPQGTSGSVYTFYKPTDNYEKDFLTIISDEYNANNHILLLSDVLETKTTTLNDYAIGDVGAVPSAIMRKIDEKIDDGMPFTGNVFGLNGKGKKDKCNNYTGENTSLFSSGNMTKQQVSYGESNDNNCIGVIVFGEFN